MTQRERLDLDGFVIFTHPYPTRSTVRVRSTAIDTGVPEHVFEALRAHKLAAFSVERPEVWKIDSALRDTIKRFSVFVRDAPIVRVPEDPEEVARYLESLQHVAATAHVRSRYAKALLRHVLVAFVLATVYSILASLVGPFVPHSPWAGLWLLASAVVGAALVSPLASDAVPRKAEDAAATFVLASGVNAAGMLGSAAFPTVIAAVAFYLSGSFLLFTLGYWAVQLRRVVYPDPQPATDQLRTTPHVHWARAIAPAWRYNRRRLPDSPDFVKQQSLWDAQQRFWARMPNRPGPYFPWVVRMPLRASYGGAALLGAPQSGKTTLMRLIMRGSIPYVPRSLVFDPKRLFYPVLTTLLREEEIALAYPFDARARVWNIAGDVDTPERAATFAKARIPDQPDASGPYWAQSARAILAAIINWLNLVKRGQWTLRDLIAATDREYLPTILKATEQGAQEYESHLSGPRQSGRPDSVIAGLAGALQPLRAIAALHDYHVRADRSFTVKDWIAGRGPRCIVFSRDREHHAALDPLNQTLFEYCAMLLLDRDVSLSTPDTFVFLDELQEIELSALEELMTNGRERGVSTIISSQSINLLNARYGKDRARALIDLCRNQAFLRLDSYDTAQIASQSATQHFIETAATRGISHTVGDSYTSGGPHSTSTSSSSTTRSYSEQHSVKSEPLLLPSVLMNLPAPAPAHGLAGYFRQEDLHAFPLLNPTWIAEHDPGQSSHPAFVPLAHATVGPFRRWTGAEFAALNKTAAKRRMRNLFDRDDDSSEE